MSRFLRRIAVLVFIFAAALLAAAPTPKPARAFEIKLCEHCRRIWNDSPSRIRAVCDANGHVKDIYACSPYCLCEVLEDKPHYKLENTMIVLWTERSQLDAIMLNTASARVLTGVKDKRELSHDPDVAAFRTDKQLAAAKSELGGETTAWEKVIERCKKLAEESEDEEESSYRPKRHRKY